MPASPTTASERAVDRGVKSARREAGWKGGWLRSVRRCDSPNFGPRPEGVAPELIVIHSISLPPGEYGGEAIQALFENRLDWNAHPYFGQIRGLRVSSHFVVRRSGEVCQFVSCDQRAWHAGASSWRGRENCNDFSIGIELEGLEGDVFEAAQYAALVPLMRSIGRRYRIAGVTGHEHIAPDRKHDPGAGFDWPGLVRALRWPHARFPSQVLAPQLVPHLKRAQGRS